MCGVPGVFGVTILDLYSATTANRSFTIYMLVFVWGSESLISRHIPVEHVSSGLACRRALGCISSYFYTICHACTLVRGIMILFPVLTTCPLYDGNITHPCSCQSFPKYHSMFDQRSFGVLDTEMEILWG